MNYFNEDNIVDLSKLLKSHIKFYAHKKEENNEIKKETLIEHTNLCNKYFIKLNKSKGIDQIFKNFESEYIPNLNKNQKELFRELLINVINFHDIGKINPYFQSEKMDNNILNKKLKEEISSNHSIISSVLYIDYFVKKVEEFKKDKEVYKILSRILFVNAYIISRHHSSLDEFVEFLNSFNMNNNSSSKLPAYRAIEFLNENHEHVYNQEINISNIKMNKKAQIILKNIEKNEDKIENSIYLYTYTKLLYSLLIASDYYATSEFMNNIEMDNFGEIKDINKFYDIYKEGSIYKSIKEYEKNEYNKEKDLTKEKNINVLRTEMFLDSQNKLKQNKDKNIFYLEAPTGSGKSNVSMNLSFKMIEEDNKLNKILYIYPFNTLVEQNIKILKNIFEYTNVLNDIAVINSLTPIKEEQEDRYKESKTEENNYKKFQKALLNRQFQNYPIVLSTHVSLFNTMFDNSKESSFAFHQLINSVIILDEIQSYKNTIWTEIISFFEGMSKILNIKFVIMSATLPNLSLLTNNKTQVCNLIEDREKYYKNALFKDRVKIDYELLEKDIDELYEHIKKQDIKNKKILVEFIKKKTAYEFFNRLKEDEEIDTAIELITGDDNTIERERVLEEINKNEGIILIATAVIEAGVDIDMDIGYKDISKLDSEEQFNGRINRSCKRDGVVYFFNIYESNKIYKNDIRTNNVFTLKDEKMRKILVTKEFSQYYEPILKLLKEEYNDRLDEYNIDKFYEDKVGKLNFVEVEKRMKLIDDDRWNMSVYLSRKINIDKGTIIDGSDVWNKYKELLMNNEMEYAQRKIELSKVRSKLSYFIYQVKKSDIIYNDRIGEIYYIEDGENYIKDNKIDKEKLTTGIGDFI